MTIAEVSKKYELTADTLRYYEKVGLIPPVRRTRGGIRNYDQETCHWVEFIKCMRGAGLPVDVLIEYVKLFRRGDETVAQRKAILVQQRDMLLARMEEMQKTLNRLNSKIEGYENSLVQKERQLSKGTEKSYE